MKPQPCFETNKELEAAARRAERRKCQAIDKLVRILGPKHRFEQAMLNSTHSHASVIDAEQVRAEGEVAMINRKTFFYDVRVKLFGGRLDQRQVDGMNAILDEWEKRDLTDLRWLAYALATAFWETAHTMWPIEEWGKGQGHPYGVPDSGDGARLLRSRLRATHLEEKLRDDGPLARHRSGEPSGKGP